ncbi:hypothetical protein R1sor_010302 [Riccia sorocarpa]|uniref:Uncharacterized protein n=1 Tax=Riccia sorocarpa TaxID=122646 RepID=A0ABD3HZ29_9MARC
MGVETDGGDFRSLLEQKEKELVSVCENQIELFQQRLLERDSEYAELITRFSQLKDDFKYNLDLLDGRDAELTRYESEMAGLHMSIKTAQAQLLETQKRLSTTERQRLEESKSSEEKEKAYHQTLVSLRQQVESLHVTREELLSMHKEALESASAELMVKAERRQAHLDNRVKALETQYQDKLRIHELQSTLAVDAMENKLHQAERQIELLEDQLDSQRAKLQHDAGLQERELRAEIRERDGSIERLKKYVDKLQTENDDLRSEAANADFSVKQLNRKLRTMEAEERKHSLQRRLQTEDLQKSLEMAESRAREWEIRRHREISFNLQKIAQLEQVIVSEENQMKLKLEAMETYVQDRLQHQDQKAKEFRSQAIYWKTQHYQLLTKYRALQKGNERSLGLDFIFDKLHVEDVITSEDVSVSQAHFERGNDLPSSNCPLRDKCIAGSVHSMGSSLPRPSPLLSPVFSSPEDNSQPFSGEEERNERVASLEEENRCLRESVQNLKEQNERTRTVVGTMRKEMEALQKTTLEEAFRSKNVGLSPEKGHIEEMRKIRDEVQALMSQIASMTSELQQVQQMNPSLPVPSLQRIEKTEEAPFEDADSKSVSYDSKEAAAKIAELERVQYVLRTQLERAAHDLIRMANERDLLMEMSNSLHADINRSHQHENSKHCVPSTEDKDHLCPARNAGPCPEDKLHECRVTGTSTSPTRRSTSPSRPPWRSGGQEPSGGKYVWINKNGIVNVLQRDQEQNVNSKHTYPDNAEQENEERRLLLEGTMTPLQERPVLQQDFIRRGTPSQRSKLRASVKRREAQLAEIIEVPLSQETAKMKV